MSTDKNTSSQRELVAILSFSTKRALVELNKLGTNPYNYPSPICGKDHCRFILEIGNILLAAKSSKSHINQIVHRLAVSYKDELYGAIMCWNEDSGPETPKSKKPRKKEWPEALEIQFYDAVNVLLKIRRREGKKMSLEAAIIEVMHANIDYQEGRNKRKLDEKFVNQLRARYSRTRKKEARIIEAFGPELE